MNIADLRKFLGLARQMQTTKESPREAAERIGNQFLDPALKSKWLPVLTAMIRAERQAAKIAATDKEKISRIAKELALSPEVEQDLQDLAAFERVAEFDHDLDNVRDLMNDLFAKRHS